MSPETPSDVLASVRSLSVGFPTTSDARTVVADVSFDLRAGRILAIVGESGSGKSVTARALLGLAGRGACITADRLEIEGQSVLGLSERRWRGLRGRRVGLVLQDALVSLDPLRTIGAEIREPLDAHRIGPRTGRQARVMQALTEAGVTDPERRVRQRSAELSGGLRQRALIASAIAARPKVLVADEPTTALDATVQRQVLDLLRDMANSGSAILLITHDIGVVHAVADEVAVMQAGRIVEHGRCADVLARPSHVYTRALLAALPRHRPTPVTTRGRRPTAIRVEGVSKAFRDPDGRSTPVLGDIGFSVEPGRTLGLVGESGSGKSTIANILLGFVEPDVGHVEILGAPWSRIPEHQRRPRRGALQMIYQDPLGSFDPRLNVAQILAGAVRAGGLTDPTAVGRRAAELLELVGLGTAYLEASPRVLSGGQRQRVAIARALAPRPSVLICDEPVSALDLTTQAQVLDLLTSVQSEFDLACVFISHDLGVVRHMSDDLIVLWRGQIVERGRTEAVCGTPSHPYTQQLFAAVPTGPVAPSLSPVEQRAGRILA